MGLKISPEMWIAKFVKSSSRGRVISAKLRRILTVVILPIWIMGFIVVAYYCYDATSALIYWNHEKETYIPGSGYPPGGHYYRQEEAFVNERVMGFFSLPIYLVVCFLLPWVVVWLVFWIKDADTQEKEEEDEEEEEGEDRDEKQMM